MPVPMLSTCNATTRERSRLFICELLLHHVGDHRDGDHSWPEAAPASRATRQL